MSPVHKYDNCELAVVTPSLSSHNKKVKLLHNQIPFTHLVTSFHLFEEELLAHDEFDATNKDIIIV